MTPQPDFLRPVRRAGRLAWAACFTALAVLAVSALEAEQAWDDRSEALEQTAPRAARAPRLPAAASAATGSRPDEARQRALLQASERLGRPWAAALRAVEASTPRGVAWLGLEIDEAGTLRLEGLAPDAATALAATRLMQARPAWRDVVLGRTELGAGTSLRFEIRAAPGVDP